jgi:hypothetical protein
MRNLARPRVACSDRDAVLAGAIFAVGLMATFGGLAALAAWAFLAALECG